MKIYLYMKESLYEGINWKQDPIVEKLHKNQVEGSKVGLSSTRKLIRDGW